MDNKTGELVRMEALYRRLRALKMWEQELAATPPDDPSRPDICARIQDLRSLTDMLTGC